MRDSIPITVSESGSEVGIDICSSCLGPKRPRRVFDEPTVVRAIALMQVNRDLMANCSACTFQVSRDALYSAGLRVGG